MRRIIKKPMDFGTVLSKLQGYDKPADFAADVRLTLNNAMAYNPEDNLVHAAAKRLSEVFESKFRAFAFNASTPAPKVCQHDLYSFAQRKGEREK